MSNRTGPPWPKGDPRAAASGAKGGLVSNDLRRYRRGEDPKVHAILDSLAGESTGGWLDRLGLTEPSWATWRVIGKVLDGAPLNATELTTYRTLTGRTSVPMDLRELWAIAGRGSGKTTFAAVCAIKAAVRRYPVRGLARVLLLAFQKDQAGVSFEYVQEFVRGDPDLRKLVTRDTTTSLTFAHGLMIQTISSNYRTVRAYSVACSICDELAHWWSDDTDANPAREVLRSLRPGLGKCPGSRLLALTTPWIEEGVVFEQHERHFGNETSAHVLVLKAPTLVLNPAYDAARITAEEEADPENAASEYGAGWRVAGGSLVIPAAYDACVDKGVSERAPVPPLSNDHYGVAVDLSGGTGQDSAALAVFHVEVDDESGTELAVQDLLVEWTPPFDPTVVCREIATICARFGCTEVTGDSFSQGFAASALRECGIRYEVSPRTTNESLIDSIAVLNTKRAILLDHAGQRKQWLNLKRDYGSGGRPGVLESRKHDDLAVVAARGIVLVLGLGTEPVTRPRAQFA